jgi:multidrug resistance efflux pump
MRREERWLGAKIAEACRTRLEELLGPYHVASKLAGAATIAVVLFMAFVRGDYRVTADALLEPAVLRASAAPFNGYIARAPVRPGDLVREGDLLGSLDDRDLRLERIKWVSEREQLLKQYRQALADRSAPQAEIFAASIEEANAELERIEDLLSRTELRAPFDGVVISGDFSQELGAPVDKGEVLFEVAPLDAYRVILKVDETDIADVEPGQTGRVVFSSLPTDSHDVLVEKLTPVATAEEGRNYFRVEARLLESSERLRPAIEGVAKIEVDRRRLIWIWTHEAIDWLRVALWRWMP